MARRNTESEQSGADGEGGDPGPLVLGLTLGFFVGCAALLVGFWAPPDGAGVWYGYAVVLAAIIAGLAAAALVGTALSSDDDE